MKVRVCFHDRCFDAVDFFSRFYRERSIRRPHLRTRMDPHRGQTVRRGYFYGDENAIVDFKYSSPPRLTWWVDHHTPADAAHFRAEHSA